MRKKVFVSVAVIACLSAMAVSKSKTSNQMSDVSLAEVKAIAHCETVNGCENDGHCVHDRAYNYFCKTPGFLQKKDCHQATSNNH